MLGIRTTEAELARRFHTTKDGTLPAQVIAGLRQLGISGRKVSVPTADLTDVRAPAMLFLVSDGHAVAFAGITNGMAEILDPACGRRRMDPTSLRDVWQGHALEFWRAK